MVTLATGANLSGHGPQVIPLGMGCVPACGSLPGGLWFVDVPPPRGVRDIIRASESIKTILGIAAAVYGTEDDDGSTLCPGQPPLLNTNVAGYPDPQAPGTRTGSQTGYSRKMKNDITGYT